MSTEQLTVRLGGGWAAPAQGPASLGASRGSGPADLGLPLPLPRPPLIPPHPRLVAQESECSLGPPGPGHFSGWTALPVLVLPR